MLCLIHILKMSGGGFFDLDFPSLRNALESESTRDLKILLGVNYVQFLENMLLNTISSDSVQLPILIIKSDHFDPINIYMKLVRLAANHGRLDVFRELFSKSSDYTVDLSEAFIIAARKGHLEMVQFLYNNKSVYHFVDPTKFSNLAFRSAAEHGHVSIVEFLLNIAVNNPNLPSETEPRVDPADGCNDALEKAAKNGHKRIVEILLTYENVKMLRNPPAIRIVGGPDEYEAMFYRPAGEKDLYYPVYVPDIYINRAYELAVQNGHTEIARLLELP